LLSEATLAQIKAHQQSITTPAYSTRYIVAEITRDTARPITE